MCTVGYSIARMNIQWLTDWIILLTSLHDAVSGRLVTIVSIDAHRLWFQTFECSGIKILLIHWFFFLEKKLDGNLRPCELNLKTFDDLFKAKINSRFFKANVTISLKTMRTLQSILQQLIVVFFQSVSFCNSAPSKKNYNMNNHVIMGGFKKY